MDSKGFTVIELLAAIAIATIVCFGAIPGMAGILEREQARSATGAMLRSLNFAREHAIYNNTFVSICPSQNGRACEPRSGNYLIVFEDDSGSGKLKSGEQILSVAHLGEKWQTRWRAFGGKPHLTLTAQGFTKHQNGSFHLCPVDSPEEGRRLIVNKAGRGRLGTDREKASC
ncbi:prepilin-type N-terminal cleavage/methylation domain-containing protein [Proteobacteria bacterium 005FR1]|nr:prepilin-type N-terminal cleavage/methylation domain-containing protein [Proteobacteria bacterium 005FR1]